GLFKVRSNGAGLTRLTGPSPESRSPAWSPAQNTIAFIRYSHGRGQIWQMHANGGRATMLHADAGISYEDPAWSRDGTRIAVVARTNGHSWIQVMNANGSHVRDLTARTGDAWNPVWLPGDRGIAWLANGGSVFATRATGTNVTRILRAQAEEFAWSGTSSSGNTTPERSC
ncbi:MAG TPA: LpqB family beta-propeller domain-containing protein, partial [Pseudonocardiaceae bacterium]|nr:LpqB family beta-propeller domain-containing protein [Pseudonocardiaceae bacterium]